VLLRVDEFCDRIRMGLRPLVTDLQEATGRYSQAESDAWSASLPRMAEVLRRTKLGDTHIRIGNRAGVSLEYRLPASSSWADAVLLGRGQAGAKALFFELKDWATDKDRPGPRAGLVEHQGKLTLHPSEQLKGYVEYCGRFHSAVHQHKAEVNGLVFMTRAQRRDPYDSPPHDALTRDLPVFCSSYEDLCEELPAYLDSQILGSDEAFAHDFETGTYRQDRSFVRQMAEIVRDPTASPFVLLDHQRLGLEQCLEAVERALSGQHERVVIVVEGPPGSGKSVLAAQLWARLATDERMKRNAVLVTTSACQRANWEDLFEKTGKGKAARGLVIPANQFNPGLTPKWVQLQRESGKHVTVSSWRANLELYRTSGGRNRMSDLSMGVSIVDEAHGLIDPTAPGKEGVAPSGWAMHAGPQAWHILRSSRVSVFLIDSQQSYRDNETTTVANIAMWAGELGVGQVERVRLDDAQFRCAGSKEYLDWLDGILNLGSPVPDTSKWRRTNGLGAFEFELAKDPQDLEDRLRLESQAGRSVRLVSSYNQPWKTKGVERPHALAPEQMDFHLEYERAGQVKEWSRIWNYAPDQDYSLFIQAPSGSEMERDPLCEVGCPYVVRGFDYDHLGVIWGADLIWRNGWTVDLTRVHESAWKKTLAAAKKGDAAALDEVVLRLRRAYRILLSRSIRGVAVWFEDAETRRHVEHCLENA
jgi:hypothetical protein